MKLKPESEKLDDYLGSVLPFIVFETPLVKSKILEIKSITNNKALQAKIAFEFVRDNISHSFDTNSSLITIGAEETIEKQEGICFAKSHLLASLLRGSGIPAGFCYQRVLRKATVESGYALHGLNALYLDGTGWFRVDPRGNKAGINSQFSTDEEKLAYPIREELGEVDYPDIFTKPLASVTKSMEESGDCHVLFYNRPEALGQG
ncbi:MAG TPA: transglutaminase family protein [Saprospiraceae bacterium]|nr:transglutaminase family protein [Saprospiraceae bacterium]MCC6688407.1 transglutaminase family protein [Saprospiraceae bacterium]HMX82731.1 transglutaminase family protein [Saprospiraceae bacterium]HMX84623.1 transglutaminase family protein [Saprospiraceae bacterium]HMZ73467.1 transglutaminase family protein [Saprospiraceae bacterium]